MATELFRKSALAALSSPEQLDQTMQLTEPRRWIALSMLTAMLVAALIWSIFGSLRSHVSGHGIIIRPGGTANIVSSGAGIVSGMRHFEVGENIVAGQVLGHITQPALELQIRAANDALLLARQERDLIALTGQTESHAQSLAFRIQSESQQNLIKGKEELLESMRRLEPMRAQYMKQGYISLQKYEELRQSLHDAENAIDVAKRTLQDQVVQQIENDRLAKERLRIADGKIASLTDRLNELTAQHQAASTLISDKTGTVVEMLASNGTTVKESQPLISVEVQSKVLVAEIYLPSTSNAKSLQPGMGAEINPVTSIRERYGYLVGKIRAVSKYPATEQGMMAVFNNSALVAEMMKAGPPVAVTVEFEIDPSSRCGYRWSSRAGAGVEVTSGTIADGRFIIASHRPISLLLPMLKEFVGS
ncbi:MAG: NHLP bacteriocin system secretion protein [Pseudomonadota bacterium]